MGMFQVYVYAMLCMRVGANHSVPMMMSSSQRIEAELKALHDSMEATGDV